MAAVTGSGLAAAAATALGRGILAGVMSGSAAATATATGIPEGWRSCTVAHMTQAGGDLVLNEGAPFGTCQHTSGVDCGAIASQVIECPFEVQANPADAGGIVGAKLEISTSDDDATYSSWQAFRTGTYYCRYYKVKATVYGDPAKGVRPKITRLDPVAAPANTEPVWPGLEDEVNTLPLQPRTGTSYLVGSSPTGALVGHAGERVYIADSTPPDYGLVFFAPVKDQLAFLKDEDLLKVHNGTEWESLDPRYLSPGHFTLMGAAEFDRNPPAGTWSVAIDASQFCNGYQTNVLTPADLDRVDYKVFLPRGTYYIHIMTRTNTDAGIIDVDLILGATTTEIASFDCYAPAISASRNSEKESGPITVSTAGLYTLRVRVDGKNAASTNFIARISYISLWRV